MKVVDKDNNPLVILADELQGRAHLVEYRSGRRLNWEGNAPNNFKPWIYTRHSNDYIMVSSFDIFLSDSYVDTQIGGRKSFFIFMRLTLVTVLISRQDSMFLAWVILITVKVALPLERVRVAKQDHHSEIHKENILNLLRRLIIVIREILM